MLQILELGIPLLDGLLIRPDGNEERDVIGAMDAPRARFDANQTSRAFVYLTVGLASIADQLIVGLLVAAPLLADSAITRTEVFATTVWTSYSIVY